MTKHLFGIFAHPDDEAFGPAGTLIQEVHRGTTVHLITLTAGEAGTNPDNLENLGEVRLREWHEAGAIIGATSMHHFGYIDGQLNNTDHLAITDRLMALVQELTSDDDEIEFMTMDLNGITGHIDHIVAGRSACLAFYRLKEMGIPVTRLRLACISETDMPSDNIDFVYMEKGYPAEAINEIIDARAYAPTITQVMRCHHTQRQDCETNLARQGDRLGINHFIVKK